MSFSYDLNQQQEIESLRKQIAELATDWQVQHAKVMELEKERESFYMDYRIKCDTETKAAQARIAELREALLSISPMAMTNKANEALSRTDDTPALNEYRNKVIDECQERLYAGDHAFLEVLKR